MSFLVFLSVISSAVFQGGWNFFAKKSKADKTSLLAAGWLFFGVALAVTLPWTADLINLDPEWLPYSLASGFIHAFYIVFLGWAYTVGEISVVYPIARGLGILWTTLASWLLGVHSFSSNGVAGVFAITIGVILIGHKVVRSGLQKKALLLAVAVSILISTYSLVDSVGTKKVPLALYLVMMNVVSAAIVLPFLMRFSKAKVEAVFRNHKREAFLIGLAGSASYFVILWAFRSSPVSYIAALREVSVIVAAALGFIFLKEEMSKRKIVGIILVAAGAVLLRWS